MMFVLDLNLTVCYISCVLACLCCVLLQVPGGVGPMTIAMLIRNTVNAAARTLPSKEDGSPSSAAAATTA